MERNVKVECRDAQDHEWLAAGKTDEESHWIVPGYEFCPVCGSVDLETDEDGPYPPLGDFELSEYAKRYTLVVHPANSDYFIHEATGLPSD